LQELFVQDLCCNRRTSVVDESRDPSWQTPLILCLPSLYIEYIVPSIVIWATDREDLTVVIQCNDGY